MRLENIGNYPSHGMVHIIVSHDDPNVTMIKMYFPEDPRSRCTKIEFKCALSHFHQGVYWGGNRKVGPGRLLKKIQKI